MELPKIKVPLILGIWGGKGQGKTFQCGLAFKKLGIAPIVMSAGELESGNAGEPAKLIRQRYREASDIIKKKGQVRRGGGDDWEGAECWGGEMRGRERERESARGSEAAEGGGSAGVLVDREPQECTLTTFASPIPHHLSPLHPNPSSAPSSSTTWTPAPAAWATRPSTP
jgi:hypothetical protein